MKIKCLLLNDREKLDENILNSLNDKIEIVWVQNNSGEFPLEDSLEKNKDVEILITTYMNLNSHNLSRLKNLKYIITTTTATEYIDKSYCQENNINVFNTAGYTGSSVAEHAVALMFCLSRKLIQINSKIRTKDFNCFNEIGQEMFGKTAGILGLGSIGSNIARIVSGIGMNVIFFNKSLKTINSWEQVPLNELLKRSDVIFISLPLNDETKSLIGSVEFKMMKKNTILVSTSPDKIIDKGALQEALSKNFIASAGLDLHSQDIDYLNIPNLILTPRRAWYTQECFERRINTWKNILQSIVNK